MKTKKSKDKEVKKSTHKEVDEPKKVSKSKKDDDKTEDKVAEAVEKKEKSQKKAPKKEKEPEVVQTPFAVYDRVQASGAFANDPELSGRTGTIDQITPNGEFMVSFPNDFGGLIHRHFTAADMKK